MIPKELAQKWIDEQVLSSEQIHMIEKDLHEYKKATSSKRIITFLSTFGALLIGFAALAFIAANWEMMTSLVRIGLFTALTIISFLFGNYWMLEHKGMPRMGFAFVFLAHLLFGVTLFLIAQQYQVGNNFHWFFLWWLLAIIPGLYMYSSQLLTVLTMVIFYVWLIYAAQGHVFLHSESILSIMILSLFGIMAKGLLHMKFLRTYSIGSTMFFSGVVLSMIFFYFTTFDFFGHAVFSPMQMQGLEWYLAVLLACTGCAGVLYMPIATKNSIEAPHRYVLWALYGLLYVSMLAYLLWPLWEYFPLLMSILFFFVSVGIGYVGYKVSNMNYVNVATFWLLLFILTKYVDMFWDLLPKSLFFFIGGLLLVILGAFFEKKRQRLQHLITK